MKNIVTKTIEFLSGIKMILTVSTLQNCMFRLHKEQLPEGYTYDTVYHMIYNLLEGKPKLQISFLEKIVIPYINSNEYLTKQQLLKKEQKVLIKLCRNYYDLVNTNNSSFFKLKDGKSYIETVTNDILTSTYLENLMIQLAKTEKIADEKIDYALDLFDFYDLLDYFVENLNQKRKQHQLSKEKKEQAEKLKTSRKHSKSKTEEVLDNAHRIIVCRQIKEIISGSIQNNEIHKNGIKIALRYNLLDFYLEELQKEKEKILIKQKKLEAPPKKPKEEKIASQKQRLSEICQLEWKNVIFYDGRYVFAPKSKIKKFRIQPLIIKEPVSQECFNYIKEYFGIKLPIINYQYDLDTGKIQIHDSIRLHNAIWMIKEEYKLAKIEKRNIKTGISMNLDSVPFHIAMSKAKQMTPFDFRKYKSKFIDFLVSKQIADACIVPMTEAFVHNNSSYTEAAFIFTINAAQDTLTVVIENVNPDRSTILFEVLKAQYMEALKAIYSFMQGPSINKRSEIREKSIVFTKYGVVRYCSINHEWLDGWKRDVLKYNRNW